MAGPAFARAFTVFFVPAFIVALFAGSAAARSATVRFSAAPSRALQGSLVGVTVNVTPAGARCSIVVRYADGALQQGLKAATPVRGRVRWQWSVPKEAGAGAARVTVSCGRAGKAERTVMVVGAVEPPRITVQQDGFTIRVRPTSASLTYGLVLANDSASLDALDVTVQVNFVDATDRLVGTMTEHVDVVPAQNTFGVAGYASFPAARLVDHLETVIRVEGHRPKAFRSPVAENLRILPNTYDAAWTGSVEGEVINDHAQLFLRGARLSAVLYDLTGKIVGGTDGGVSSVLPPGTRQFYKLTSGLNNIPVEKAVTARLWIQPNYTQA